MADSKEFPFIWEYVISPISKIVLEECDSDFAEEVHLRYRGSEEWYKLVEKEFHHYRHNFKEQCYGKRRTEAGDPLLDSRKVAAVLCQTCLSCKAFEIDVQSACLHAEKKKLQLTDTEYTVWAANNTLINYKFAYLVSHNMVYLALLADLLEKKDVKSTEMAKHLNKVGHLFRYPTALGCDTIDVNIIVGLARGDEKGQKLNMLLYAMLLYQNEMYTFERLKYAIDKLEAAT